MAKDSELTALKGLERWAGGLMVGLIRFYQWVLSPWVGGRCRHFPSCSAYAIEAIRVHGAFSGGWLAAKRLSRCHPWGTWGADPVPPRREPMV